MGRLFCPVAPVVAASLLIAMTIAVGEVRAETEIALVGGDVYTVEGGMIPHGTVIIRGEKIALVGKDLPVPPQARVVSCVGKWITPGLIEGHSQIGLTEIDLVRETADGSTTWSDPVRAAVRADDAIDLRSPLIAVARRQGVTSAVSVPGGGLIQGRSVWIDLASPATPTSSVFARALHGLVAMHATLGEGGARAVGSSRAIAMMRLREVFEDARVFKRDRSAFDRNALRDLSASRLDLEALGEVVSGRMRFVVEVHRASDILAVLALAKSEQLDIALVGASEGWIVAPAIAAAGVPVFVNPAVNIPLKFEEREARAANAAILARAGVKVSITTESSHNAGWLRFHLGNAVRAGLPWDVALRAGTLGPAEIFGMARSHGSIRSGKVANLVVWSGDPFEPSTRAETILIGGDVQPLSSRQTRLRDRYLGRLGLATGRGDSSMAP